MPRSFAFSIESPDSVEQILWAFSEEDYWLARIAHFGGFARLDTFSTGSDGAVTVEIVQDARHEGMPKLVARFYPSNWRVVQSETWSPAGDGVIHGEVAITTHGAPGSGRGTALLEPTDTGSRLHCNATVEFNVPLVGGKVENIVGRQLAKQFTVIQNFTSKWITENA